MKTLLAAALLIAALVSCDTPSPKINHALQIDTVATVDNRLQDSSKIVVAELPIKFDSTEVLLHAVGLVDLQERDGYSTLSSGSYGSSGTSSSYFNNDALSGSFINIIFEDSAGSRVLTKNIMTIKEGIFLRAIYKSLKKGYILYLVYDRDTNGDKKYDHHDVEALYISEVDGTGLHKLSPELHEVQDYKLLPDENRLYFRTLEDINQDGKLNNQDQFHYYMLQFTEDGHALEEYNPLDIVR